MDTVFCQQQPAQEKERDAVSGGLAQEKERDAVSGGLFFPVAKDDPSMLQPQADSWHVFCCIFLYTTG
jgi:hypothetical protein